MHEGKFYPLTKVAISVVIFAAVLQSSYTQPAPLGIGFTFHTEATDLYASGIRGATLTEPRLTWASGFHIERQIGSSRWTLGSGWMYLNRGTTILRDFGSGILQPNGQPEQKPFDTVHRMLGIPILATRYFRKFYIAMGPQIDIRLFAFEHFRGTPEKRPFVIPFFPNRAFTLSVVLTAGYQAPISSRIHFNVETRLNPEVISTLRYVSWHHINYGFGLGLQYRIGK